MEPQEALRLLRDWVQCNPRGVGPGWEPYPLSLRIREWVEWMVGRAGLGEPVAQDLLESLVDQVEALSCQVEQHLQGNHLLENAITLCWAALGLEGGRCHRWGRLGWSYLRRELRAQVLDDGTHAERSPMYQALLAESLLRLARVAADANGAFAREVLGVALSAGRTLARTLSWLSYPDGEHALVHDTAEGLAPTWADLRRRFPDLELAPAPLPRRQRHPRGGFLAATAGPGTWLLLDAGGMGPDHQPGHGHAGALGFDLSIHGRRTVQDTGVSTYAIGAERAWDRSTAAHSTVEVDGRSQSEVWASFRVGRRIQPLRARAERGDDRSILQGGYRVPWRRAGSLVHRRRLVLTNTGLAGTDRLRVQGRHEAVWRFHMAPGVSAREHGGSVMLAQGGAPIGHLRSPSLRWEIGSSPCHPTFGANVERACVLARMQFEGATTAMWEFQFA